MRSHFCIRPQVRRSKQSLLRSRPDARCPCEGLGDVGGLLGEHLCEGASAAPGGVGHHLLSACLPPSEREQIEEVFSKSESQQPVWSCVFV